MSRKPRTISPENKMVVQYVTMAFGGTPHVDEYGHNTEDLTVGILYCHNRPTEGVTSYSTIRLSDYPMMGVKGEFQTRLELAGVCATTTGFFPNVLASAAFSIMRTGDIYYPGTVMPNFIRQYSPSSVLPHLYLTAPFLWQDDLKTLNCGTKKVSWLLAMPIAESEYLYLKEHGDEALEHLFEQEEIDIFDLNRLPVV